METNVGEEAGALSLTDIAVEARNVRDVDGVLMLSKMGTDLRLCQVVAMEHCFY